MKKNSGITLLELMLSLAIIAILLIAAMRYFESTRSSQRVNDGIQSLQSAMQASDNWYATFKSFTGTSAGDINVTALINMNLLPTDFAVNPWGGAASITAADASHVQIELTDISKNDCNQLEGIMKQHGFTGTCTDSSYSVTYP